jgi:hypothetical protein
VIFKRFAICQFKEVKRKARHRTKAGALPLIPEIIPNLQYIYLSTIGPASLMGNSFS